MLEGRLNNADIFGSKSWQGSVHLFQNSDLILSHLQRVHHIRNTIELIKSKTGHTNIMKDGSKEEEEGSIFIENYTKEITFKR